jgi:hypothetical protein
MVLMTIAECEQWCAARGIDLSSRRLPSYHGVAAMTAVVHYEERPAYQQVTLGDYFAPTWEEVPFTGAFVWIQRRDAWAEYDTAVGEALLTALRPGPDSIRRALDEWPGHLFGADERAAFHGCFLLTRVMSWDALVVPLAEDYLVSVCHDGFAVVVSRTAEMATEIAKRLGHWPKPSKSVPPSSGEPPSADMS